MKAGRLDPLSGWLVSGRVGKTRLCQSLSDAEYFDCELAFVGSSSIPNAFSTICVASGSY
jgi:hypothetical protein